MCWHHTAGAGASAHAGDIVVVVFFFFVCFFTHGNTSSPLYPRLNPASCTSFLLQVPLLDGHLSPCVSISLVQPQMKWVKVLSFFLSWSSFFIIMFFFHCLFISFLCQCLHHLVHRTEKKAKYQKLSKTQTEMEKKGTAKWGPASYPETTTHAAPMWFTPLVTLDTEKQSVICYHTVATCCYSRLFDNNKSEDDYVDDEIPLERSLVSQHVSVISLWLRLNRAVIIQVVLCGRVHSRTCFQTCTGNLK